MSAPDIILKLSNVEGYDGPTMAVRGISLKGPRAKIVTLLSSSGAGQTNVLKTISGILDLSNSSAIDRVYGTDKIVRSACAMCAREARRVPDLERAREPEIGALSVVLKHDPEPVFQDDHV